MKGHDRLEESYKSLWGGWHLLLRAIESHWKLLSATTPLPWPFLETQCCLCCCWTAALLHHGVPGQCLGKAYVDHTPMPEAGDGEKIWKQMPLCFTVEVALPPAETHEMGHFPKHRGMGFRFWAVKIWSSFTSHGTPLHVTQDYPIAEVFHGTHFGKCFLSFHKNWCQIKYVLKTCYPDLTTLYS